MTLLSNKVIKSVTDKILSGSGLLHLSQLMFVSCNQIHSVHQSSKYWYVYAQQLSRRLSFDHVPLVPSWSHSYIYSWPVFEMSYRISKCLNILLLMTELCLQWSLKPSRHCYSLYLSVCVCVCEAISDAVLLLFVLSEALWTPQGYYFSFNEKTLKKLLMNNENIEYILL